MLRAVPPSAVPFVLLSALQLAACEGTTSATCAAGFRGGSLAVDASSCAGCRIEDAELAIDGSGLSAAQMQFNALGLNPAGGQLGLRAGGREFGGGSTVGAYLQFPSAQPGGYTSVAVSFVTSRGGVQQEVIEGSGTTVGNLEGAGETRFYGGPSGLPFDAVEVRASLSGTARPASVLIYEICGQR